MDCEQLRAKLDAYMDGELTQSELGALEAHAATCEDCARELAAAKLVRESLASLGDEVAVPLEVQAKWRRAIRAEAEEQKRRKLRGRLLRIGYGVAAALALALGATALLRQTPGQGGQPMTVSVEPASGQLEAPGEAVSEPETVAAQPRLIAALPTEAVVASDGEAEEAAVKSAQDEGYAAWKKFSAENVEAARASVEALAEEYSGSCELVEEALDAPLYVCRVKLPSVYLDEFLNAVSHTGEELDSVTRTPEGDTAVVYIQIEAGA